MTNETEVRWDRMTAPDIRAAAPEKTVVIIPLGATEQHGPHLPMQVDWRSAYEISMRAAKLMAGRQRALFTPAIPFGMSEHHMSLGGTLTVDYATMAAIVGCVVRSAIPGVNPAMFRWQRLKTRSSIGILGEARAATPEKGRRLKDAISKDIADALADQDCGTRRFERILYVCPRSPSLRTN